MNTTCGSVDLINSVINRSQLSYIDSICICRTSRHTSDLPGNDSLINSAMCIMCFAFTIAIIINITNRQRICCCCPYCIPIL